MHVDGATLMVVSGLIVILCGVMFVLNTSFNGNDEAGRLWSVSFICAMAVAVAYGLNVIGPETRWHMVVGNLALVLAAGFVWCANRRYNLRRPALWVVAAVAVVAAVSTVCTIVPGGGAGEWAGAFPVWIGVALLSALGGWEALRARLRRNINGRILGVVLWIVASFSALRAVAFLVDGERGAIFTAYFNSAVAAALTMSFMVMVSIALSVLRAEQRGNNALADVTVGTHSATGTLAAGAFVQVAADHLDRAKHGRLGLALIGAEIDNLPELNRAFGRISGDQAIVRFAQTIRENSPVMALIGHQKAGRFLLLVSVASATEAVIITERIRATLVDGALPQWQAIRTTASFGIADTFDHGYNLTALSTAVGVAIAKAKRGGGNHIQGVQASR